MRQNEKENRDLLKTELKNATILKNTVKKLTTLLSIIGPADDIGYLEDNEANNDYGMVNNWIKNIEDKKIYPSKDTLILANKLWKKYYFRLQLDEAETMRY